MNRSARGRCCRSERFARIRTGTANQPYASVTNGMAGATGLTDAGAAFIVR
jgi:hypothetical protein